MFLTQADSSSFQKSLHLQRSKSVIKKRFSKLSSNQKSQKQLHELKKSSFNSQTAKNGQIKQFRHTNPQRKWNKMVNLFNLHPNNKEQEEEIKQIRPGVAFYQILANKLLLDKYPLKINFPETYMEHSGDLIQIKTNQLTGLVQSRKIQREQYTAIMTRSLERQIIKIQHIPTKYKKHYDYRENGFAPVIVTKTADQFQANFDVDIQNFKNFNQRRSRPSGDKLVQRFIYSRNMRAMVMRICFKKKKQNEQREQFWAYRFQNTDNIFRVNKKNNEIFQTFKAQSTISANYYRQDKIEYSKITNMKGLQRYIEPSKQLIKFLEQTHKIKINQIYIDFVIDLLDKPWVINLKKISYEDVDVICGGTVGSLHHVGGYGMCRLCCCEYLKVQLRKSISNKMLCEFLEHLRKRMKVSQYQNIGFIKQIIKKNTKNYITLQVCEGCYRIVAEQYKLIESEKKLAKICNIQTEEQLYSNEFKNRSLNLPSTLKQWRLMLYFVGISSIPHQLIKDEQDIVLRYKLGNSDGVEHSWKIKTLAEANPGSFNGNFNLDLSIKKVKIHYFYSQTMNIDKFLKQTQISLQLATLSTQKIFAKGSSGIISCFGRQFQPDLCLRQTSSILLFYNSGQYCEMTFKVGIICDGEYNLPDNMGLKQLNNTYFTGNNFTNSNPIPKQWMEAFGVSHDIQIPESNYEDIMKPAIDDNLRELVQWPCEKVIKKRRNALERRSLHLYTQKIK